jgi:hypothetical protein
MVLNAHEKKKAVFINRVPRDKAMNMKSSASTARKPGSFINLRRNCANGLTHHPGNNTILHPGKQGQGIWIF